jgi:hypothetical protein
LSSVGACGQGVGNCAKISPVGLNEVRIIHTTGSSRNVAKNATSAVCTVRAVPVSRVKMRRSTIAQSRATVRR